MSAGPSATSASPAVDLDVAVVGAGFSGLATACFCAAWGLQVRVLERRPELAPEGVGVLLQPNGLSVLQRLGILEQVLEAGQRIDTIRMCDVSGRPTALARYGELRHPHPHLLMIERTALISLLAKRLPDTAQLRTGCEAISLEHANDRVCGVRYADPSGATNSLRAACVVAADGVNSALRRALGIKMEWVTGPDPYVIGLAPCEQRDENGAVYYGDGWCDGVIPLRGRTYFFDHLTSENRDAVERRDLEAWRKTYLERVPEADRIVAGLGSFDDVSVLPGRTHRAKARVRPGIALAGDAAAAVHPHSGQGANLALEDGLVLASAFAAYGPGSPAALRAYAQARDRKLRRYVPWSIVAGRALDGPGPGWRALRRLSFLSWRSPAARRTAIRQQAGLG